MACIELFIKTHVTGKPCERMGRKWRTKGGGDQEQRWKIECFEKTRWKTGEEVKNKL